MTLIFHLLNAFSSHSSFHCSANSSFLLQKLFPTTRVTTSPSVLSSSRRESTPAGTEQRTADWQMTCGSTKIRFPSKQGYTDTDSGAEEKILSSRIFKFFCMRGKEKRHTRCLQGLYMSTSESDDIMHQNYKTNH